jgi:hypothetical protein
LNWETKHPNASNYAGNIWNCKTILLINRTEKKTRHTNILPILFQAFFRVIYGTVNNILYYQRTIRDIKIKRNIYYSQKIKKIAVGESLRPKRRR